MVDRDPIELIEQLKLYAEHARNCDSQPCLDCYAYERCGREQCESCLGKKRIGDCTCGLDALLGSARLQKEKEEEKTLTHVDSLTQSDLGATGGKNELASAVCPICGRATVTPIPLLLEEAGQWMANDDRSLTTAYSLVRRLHDALWSLQVTDYALSDGAPEGES